MTTAQQHPWYRSLDAWQLGLFGLMLVSVSLSIAVSQISLGLVLALILYRGLVQRRWPAPTGVETAALALALWALGMIPLSTDPGQSAVFYRRFFLFTSLWAGSAVANSVGRRRGLLVAMLIGAVAAAVYGEVLLMRQSGGVFARRLWTATNPMTSGAMLMLVVVTVIGYLAVGGRDRRFRWLVGLLALPVFFALLQTMTRSALLGLMAGVGAIVLLIRPRWFVVFALVLAVFLGVIYGGGDAVVPAGLWRRINPEQVLHGANTTARLEMWRGGWAMVKAHPWTGVGDCDLQAVSPHYYGNEKTVYIGHLHNNLVMQAAIWGVPGLLLSQIFVFMPLVLLVRRWRALGLVSDGRAGDLHGAGWIAGAVGVWAAFYVAGMTEWYFGDAEPMMLYLGILGIALGRGMRDIRGVAEDKQPKEQQ